MTSQERIESYVQVSFAHKIKKQDELQKNIEENKRTIEESKRIIEEAQAMISKSEDIKEQIEAEIDQAYDFLKGFIEFEKAQQQKEEPEQVVVKEEIKEEPQKKEEPVAPVKRRGRPRKNVEVKKETETPKEEPKEQSSLNVDTKKITEYLKPEIKVYQSNDDFDDDFDEEFDDDYDDGISDEDGYPLNGYEEYVDAEEEIDETKFIDLNEFLKMNGVEPKQETIDVVPVESKEEPEPTEKKSDDILCVQLGKKDENGFVSIEMCNPRTFYRDVVPPEKRVKFPEIEYYSVSKWLRFTEEYQRLHELSTHDVFAPESQTIYVTRKMIHDYYPKDMVAALLRYGYIWSYPNNLRLRNVSTSRIFGHSTGLRGLQFNFEEIMQAFMRRDRATISIGEYIDEQNINFETFMNIWKAGYLVDPEHCNYRLTEQGRNRLAPFAIFLEAPDDIEGAYPFRDVNMRLCFVDHADEVQVAELEAYQNGKISR